MNTTAEFVKAGQGKRKISKAIEVKPTLKRAIITKADTITEAPTSKKSNILNDITRDVIEMALKAKINQTKISEITGKDKATISRIVKGERAFSLDDLNMLIIHTDLPVGLLVIKYLQKGDNIPDHLQKAYKTLEESLEDI